LRQLVKDVIRSEIEYLVRGENPDQVLTEYFDFLKKELAAQKAHREMVDRIKISAIGWLTITICSGLLAVGGFVGKAVYHYVNNPGAP